MNLKAIFEVRGPSKNKCPECDRLVTNSSMLECDHCGDIVHQDHNCDLYKCAGSGTQCPECHKGKYRRYNELYRKAG